MNACELAREYLCDVRQKSLKISNISGAALILQHYGIDENDLSIALFRFVMQWLSFITLSALLINRGADLMATVRG
ncbi:unnamed protein product [Wuchereria bancrofti]|uniref:Uncharacterized protein n=1 Tax=Wuchereria bancrofti TaxID=6293 RepID=A0A3P7DS82_WUCBA|nr:unnamed protein product [Wuchereria bancrofti]